MEFFSDLISRIKNRENILRNFFFILLFTSVLIIVFFYLAPLQSAQSEQNSETIIYFADNMTSAHQRLIEMYNERNKGHIKVKPINLDHHKLDTNRRKELITRNLRSQRSKVDLFAIDHIWMPRFANWAEPLDNYISKEEIDNILPELLRSCYNEDKLYTLPFFYDLGVMYYREDIIKKLSDSDQWLANLESGITWEQLFKLKKLYFKNKPVYVFQAKAYEGLICNYLEIGTGLGIPLSNQTNFIFNKPDIMRLNHFLKTLVKIEKVVPERITQFDETSSFVYALENDIPLIRAWVTNICNINYPVEYQEKITNLRIAPLPHAKGQKFSMALGGWNLIISKYSRNKKQAAHFLQFIISKQAQSELLAEGCHLPVIKNVDLENEKLREYLIKPLAKKWIKNSVSRPSNISYTRLSDIYSTLINNELEGRISANEFYEIAKERINQKQRR